MMGENQAPQQHALLSACLPLCAGQMATLGVGVVLVHQGSPRQPVILAGV